MGDDFGDPCSNEVERKEWKIVGRKNSKDLWRIVWRPANPDPGDDPRSSSISAFLHFPASRSKTEKFFVLAYKPIFVARQLGFDQGITGKSQDISTVNAAIILALWQYSIAYPFWLPQLGPKRTK